MRGLAQIVGRLLEEAQEGSSGASLLFLLGLIFVTVAVIVAIALTIVELAFYLG